MKVFTISAEGRAAFKDIENSLEAFYSEIGCRLIDIVHYEINGKRYDIVCDDEGLFAAAPVITAVDQDHKPALVGGLIVANFDGEDDLTDLEPEDVLRIANAVQYTIQQDRVQPVLLISY